MRNLLRCIAFVFIFLSISQVKATHVMGGEITYKNVGSNKLEVTITVYRDCNGIALSNSPLSIKSDSGGIRSYSLPLISITNITGVNPKCPSKSRCDSNATYKFGVEQHIFRGTVDLSLLKGCEYLLSWTQCCRNSNITTGAANANYYMEATYNKCLTPNNSSPSFLSYPVLFLGIGNDISVSHTAVDTIDNDEITYELTKPLSAQGAKINYLGQWSIQRPLTFLGFPNAGLNHPAGFRFDSLTSNMSFRPNVPNQSTVVSIKVKEWRKINGVRTQISETHRDIQLIFISSPNNNAPKIGNTLSSIIKACTPGTYCITIPVEDKDSSDTLSVQVRHNFKNLTVTKDTISPNKINFKICYTVDSTIFNNSGSYYFKIIAEDDYCPSTARIEKTYFFRRDSASKIVFPLLPIFCENDTPIALLPSTTYGTWSGAGINGPTFSPQLAGKGRHKLVYSFNDTTSGCSNKDSLWIRVLQQPIAKFIANKNIGLGTDTFKFTDSTIADTAFQSLWNMGQPGTLTNLQTTKNTSHVYNDSGKFIVWLKVDNGICAADSTQDTVVISIPLSINKLSQNSIKLYPNPASNIINIKAETEITTITIYDIQGKVVFSRKDILNTTVPITITSFKEGVYILKTEQKNGEVSRGKFRVIR